jgi:hypothetical protein
MAYTQSDLDALDEAIANHATSVTFSDGRSVQYERGEDLIRRREYVAAQLSGVSRTRRRYGIARFDDVD